MSFLWRSAAVLKLDDRNKETTFLVSLLNRFNQCFGVIGVLDYLHGTNDSFRSSKGYERHTLLLGTDPAYVVYPDPGEKRVKPE